MVPGDSGVVQETLPSPLVSLPTTPHAALVEILSGKAREEVVQAVHAHLDDVRLKVSRGTPKSFEGSPSTRLTSPQAATSPPPRPLTQNTHTHTHTTQSQVEAQAVPLNKFIITKQLTKQPSDYPDAKNQPHVQVALRRLAAGKRDGVAQVGALAVSAGV